MEKLKELRRKKGYSGSQMAKKVGISVPFYSQIESGQRRLSYEMAVKIANVLKTKPDRIFYDEYASLLDLQKEKN